MAQCEGVLSKVGSGLVQFKHVLEMFTSIQYMRGSRVGGGRYGPALKNHKNMAFLSNTGPDH